MMDALEIALNRAAALVADADGLLITAGAGMGVDSGLPDFRGDAGFWKAYPPLAQTRISFRTIARQTTFHDTPELAWGFYGHRLALYRATVPHAGFALLHDWAKTKEHGSFVYTSNVDGQFQKAGFDENRIAECHGSIHHLQCLAACVGDIWNADELIPDIDMATCMLRSPLPRCPHCGGLARPNILMFEDWTWLPRRTDAQVGRFAAWIKKPERLVTVELGAGTAIPTIRNKGQLLDAPLIRINPVEYSIHRRDAVSIPLGSLDGLQRIARRLEK